jgi:hypothetical protein
MAVTIQVRRDVAANWSLRNPVLEPGEIGFETDTQQIKVGNGYHGWNSLPYSFGNPFDYISDGPADNFQYARQNGAWVKVQAGAGAPTRTAVSAGSTGVLDTLDSTVYRSAKWMITVADTFNGLFRTQETMALHDGSGATHVNYSFFGTSLPYLIDVQLINGDITLRCSNNGGVALQVDAVQVANLTV